MDKLQIIKFKGQEFLVAIDAITTKEAYENGQISFAHIYDDRGVFRFGKKIGEKSDVEYTDKYEEVDPTPEAFGNLMGNFLGEDWEE